MVRNNELIELGRTQFTSPIRVFSSPGPNFGWKSIVQVSHEYHARTTRRLYLSIRPIRDEVLYVVTTTVRFRNGQQTVRHSNFQGSTLEAVFELATQLTLRDYKAQRLVIAA
jgi:hypothetical protein